MFNLMKTRFQGDLIAAFQHFKVAYRKDGDKFLAGPIFLGQGGMVLNLKELIWIRKI